MEAVGQCDGGANALEVIAGSLILKETPLGSGNQTEVSKQRKLEAVAELRVKPRECASDIADWVVVAAARELIAPFALEDVKAQLAIPINSSLAEVGIVQDWVRRVRREGNVADANGKADIATDITHDTTGQSSNLRQDIIVFHVEEASFQV